MAIQKICYSALVVSCFIVAVHSIQFPSRKTWWAKQITDDLHVTGRLTEDQIKYAFESGYKSIISLFTFPSRDYVGPGDTDPLPSTMEASELATDIGFHFSTILSTPPSDPDWVKQETLKKFSEVFAIAPKPAILHCVTSYDSAFIGLLFFLQRSKNDPDAEPKMNATTLFQQAAVLGYDFTGEKFMNLVLFVDGSENSTPNDPYPRPDIDLPNWYAGTIGWTIKPLAKNLYLSGQISSTEFPLLKTTGYSIVINLRRGVTSGGVPSQEETILLNIKDRTGTYNSSGYPIRQNRETLESNRIDPTKPTSYISSDSAYNYQSRNVLQFGDAIGYNETLEAEALRDLGLEYHHLPVGGVYKYDLGLWEVYRDSLMELGRTKSSILIQCRTGYRSAVVGLLMHGCLYGIGSDEALELAYNIGYQFKNYPDSIVVKFLRDVLDNPELHCGSSNVYTNQPPEMNPTNAASKSNTHCTFTLNLILLYMMIMIMFKRGIHF